MENLQAIFTASVLKDCTTAVFFRMKRSDAAFERNRNNLHSGRTDWWSINDSRINTFDAIVLLIDSPTQIPDEVEIWAARYGGDWQYAEKETSGGRALFSDGKFQKIGATFETGLNTFCNQGTIQGTNYISRDKHSPPIKLTKEYAEFIPKFNPEFQGANAVVAPKNHIRTFKHGLVVNALRDYLIKNSYSGFDSNPHDLSAENMEKQREIFEVKTSATLYDLYAAIGQLIVYPHKMRQEFGLVHHKKIAVFPECAVSRSWRGLLMAQKIDLILYAKSAHEYQFIAI